MTNTHRRQIIPNFNGVIEVNDSIINTTEQHFRFFGSQHTEAYVWWAGCFESALKASVEQAFLFDQSSRSFGHVTLSAAELRKAHQWLKDEGLVLMAELHTHPPGASGQSYLDSLNPATTYRGFVSIVVPDFCLQPLDDLTHCFVYRYLQNNKWSYLGAEEITELLKIKEK